MKVAAVLAFALIVTVTALGYLSRRPPADPEEAARAIDDRVRDLGEPARDVRVVLSRGRRNPGHARVRVAGAVPTADDLAKVETEVRGACRSVRYDFKQVEFLVAVTAPLPETPKGGALENR